MGIEKALSILLVDELVSNSSSRCGIDISSIGVKSGHDQCRYRH
jgi:hypothetical protein